MSNKIKEIQEARARLEAEEIAAVQELEDQYRAYIKTLSPVYNWEVKRSIYMQGWPDNLQELPAFVVNGKLHLSSRRELATCMETYGKTPDWRDIVSSVKYYRNKHGVLTHGGGGCLVLDEPRPITQADFDQILKSEKINEDWITWSK